MVTFCSKHWGGSEKTQAHYQHAPLHVWRTFCYRYSSIQPVTPGLLKRRPFSRLRRSLRWYDACFAGRLWKESDFSIALQLPHAIC